jgi:hypothetical protein
VVPAQVHARQRADAAFTRHGPGEAVRRNADAHATLHQREGLLAANRETVLHQGQPATK